MSVQCRRQFAYQNENAMVTLSDIRRLTPATDNVAYFQTGGFSPKPTPVIEEVIKWLHFQNQGPALSWVSSKVQEVFEATRTKIAHAINAHPDEIMLNENTTVGINVAQVKVASFAISAAYAGIAGSLSVLVNRVADGSNPLIYFQYSIEFLIAVVIGGAATLTGPFLGSALLVGIRKRFEGTEAMAPALLGVALIAAVFLMPDGLVGLYRRLAARVRSSVPSEPSDTAATTVEAAVPINLNKGANQ